ncbi:hypothetical protein BOX15_Mlig019084g1 [Macrostomum lignano]|uniref:Uncharacterized protein n=1 Tax=Macrostomum lignano TaxID=282301 RepID=A0A267EL23_9PLAT|nr:hypothetical protein BOX15_Mlig019084g1 [Macrostomum lignano]
MAAEKLTDPDASKCLRRQMFKSLTKIERYLKRHDPQGLQRISEWYKTVSTTDEDTTDTVPSAAEHDDEQRLRRQRRKLRRQKRKQKFKQLHCYEYSINHNGSDHNGWVRRVEQNEIHESKLAYLRIPRGIASRSLLVPPQPDWLFSDLLPDVLPEDESFQLNSNVSNAEESSRRSAERELTRMRLDRWVFLYFLMLRANWESTVVEEKKSAPDVNMYAEEHLHKWTVRLRFKIMRQVAMKVALCGFLSRLGLESNTKIVFCRDGFYGLMDVGNIYGETTKTPYAMISLNSTPSTQKVLGSEERRLHICQFVQRHAASDDGAGVNEAGRAKETPQGEPRIRCIRRRARTWKRLRR